MGLKPRASDSGTAFLSTDLPSLIAAVERLFPALPMPRPGTSREPGSSALARWSGYLDYESFEARVTGSVWLDLDDQFLEFHHDALAYLDPEDFARLFPAYFRAWLRNSDALDMLPQYMVSALTRVAPDGEMFDARFGAMTEPQRQLVARAVQHLASQDAYSYYAAELQEALDAYWRDQLGS